MVRFQLELVSDAPDPVSEFSRGHVTVVGDEGTASSRGMDPDQSTMLFPSAVELLDGVRRFLLDDSAPEYRFVGVDSSFQFVLRRDPAEGIRVIHEGTPIATVDQTALAQAVWTAVTELYSRHGHRLDQQGAVAADLESAIEAFERAFDVQR